MRPVKFNRRSQILAYILLPCLGLDVGTAFCASPLPVAVSHEASTHDFTQAAALSGAVQNVQQPLVLACRDLESTTAASNISRRTPLRASRLAVAAVFVIALFAPAAVISRGAPFDPNDLTMNDHSPDNPRHVARAAAGTRSFEVSDAPAPRYVTGRDVLAVAGLIVVIVGLFAWNRERLEAQRDRLFNWLAASLGGARNSAHVYGIMGSTAIMLQWLVAAWASPGVREAVGFVVAVGFIPIVGWVLFMVGVMCLGVAVLLPAWISYASLTIGLDRLSRSMQGRGVAALVAAIMAASFVSRYSGDVSRIWGGHGEVGIVLGLAALVAYYIPSAAVLVATYLSFENLATGNPPLALNAEWVAGHALPVSVVLLGVVALRRLSERSARWERFWSRFFSLIIITSALSTTTLPARRMPLVAA